MRWPFAVAYLAIVATGFALDWRLGLAALAWLPLSYISRLLTGFPRSRLRG